jgi:1-acyl-sn-glycerol-3-phosphate acyltransferase
MTRVFITIYIALLMLSTWIIAFSLQMVVILPCYIFLDKYTRITVTGKIFRGCSAFVIYLNPFWKVIRVNPLPKGRPHKTLVMCNHVSNADPFIMSNALFPWETKYVSKASLFKVPFGGWAMKLAGDIAVYFTKEKGGWGVEKGTTGKMFTYCKKLLENGIPITVFPEGQRSKTGEMQEFKPGMFDVALEASASILPVGIYGSGAMWPVGDWKFGPATVYVAFGEPIQATGTREELIAKVKAEILRLREVAAARAGKK